MRSPSGTKSDEPSVVVYSTNSTMACFAGPPFQEGKASCARGPDAQPAARSRLDETIRLMAQFPAWFLIASSIFALTASRLKLAPFCMGGYSIAVCASLATSCCTKTKRQNSYTNDCMK